MAEGLGPQTCNVGRRLTSSANRLLPLVTCAAIAFTISACSPEVMSYQATPRRLCPGSSTWLRWSVKGNATLSAEPPLEQNRAVGANDSVLISPLRSTVFTLTAVRFGKRAFARQEITLLDPSVPRTIADTASAIGSDSLEAIARLDTMVWDSKALVRRVVGRSGRALVVLHGGKRAQLADDSVGSIALAGTRLGGVWVMHAPLLVGDVIGDSTHAPPDRLRLLVHFDCER
jgi:hypothetical protein